MAFDLNTNYLQEHTKERGQFYVKSIVTDELFDYIHLETGVKHKELIPYLDVNIVGQLNSKGFNPSGGTDIRQFEVSVCDIKVDDEFWVDALNKYFTNELMDNGSWQDGLPAPIEDIFSQQVADGLKDYAVNVWFNGSPDNSDTSLRVCNGAFWSLKNIYSAATDYTGAANIVAKTAITESNAIEIVDHLYVNQFLSNAECKKDSKLPVTLFVSISAFHKYLNCVRNFKSPTYAPNATVETGVPHFNNSNLIIKPFYRIESDDVALLGFPKRYMFVTDMVDNISQSFKFIPDEKQDTIAFKSKHKQGFAMAFPERTVNMV